MIALLIVIALCSTISAAGTIALLWRARYGRPVVQWARGTREYQILDAQGTVRWTRPAGHPDLRDISLQRAGFRIRLQDGSTCAIGAKEL